MIYRFAGCTVDSRRRELLFDGEVRHLEPQVFDLLVYLIENRERVVSRDDALRAIAADRFVSDAVLSTRLKALREAIGDDGAEQRLIRTYRRKGLRFVGEAREKNGPRLETSPSEITTDSNIARQPKILLGLKETPAVVVLPLACIGCDRRGNPFADGLTEELINALHRLDWLLVVSCHSFSGSNDAEDWLTRAVQTLHARYVLQGSIRWDGDHARIVVRLTDRASGYHLWVERYTLDITDTFRSQDEIATRVVTAVSGHVFAAEVLRATCKSPESLKAFEVIAAAVSLMNTRKKAGVRMAQAMLRKAIGIDPKSAPCFSLLSIMATLSVHLGWNAQETARPIALRAAEKALDLNSEDGWGHVARGYARLLIDNRPEEAIDVLAAALKLNPNLAIAHYFIALASVYTGNTAASFRHADLSEHLAPYDLLALGNAGMQDNVRATASFVAGRYQDGIAFAQKTIALSPRQTPAYRQLVLNHAFAGDRQEAAAAFATLKTLAPNISRWLRQQETRWSNRQDCEKYVDAFRLAGMK